ncbi:MAG: MmgE/PrpD family protein, partial [Betaproteobacteria bacterium]|nr:MmgE/PrpD family protein [Betaproteobacteria bacterium]
ASNALLATLLAGGRLDGVEQPLNGEDGLSRVYLHDSFDARRATADLGTRFEIDRLSFKPYPTCRLTHPAISAALRLRAELGDAVHQAERIELIIGPQAYDVVGRSVAERLTPATRIAAQFSVYWCVAATLVHGELTPRQLVEEIPPSARIRACIARIECRADTAAAQRDVGGCTLRAHGPFGTREAREANAKGHPDNPLSNDELLAKFKSNVRLAGVTADAAEQLAQRLLDFENIPDVLPFLAQLGTFALE